MIAIPPVFKLWCRSSEHAPAARRLSKLQYRDRKSTEHPCTRVHESSLVNISWPAARWIRGGVTRVAGQGRRLSAFELFGARFYLPRVMPLREHKRISAF